MGGPDRVDQAEVKASRSRVPRTAREAVVAAGLAIAFLAVFFLGWWVASSSIVVTPGLGTSKLAELDLAAQQSMAETAIKMLVVSSALSLLSLAATTIGIVYVWRTLRATRKANRIAQDSAHRQLRAYIVTKELRVKKLVVGERPHFEVVLINSGQTPARRLKTIVGFVTVESRDAKFRLFERDSKPPAGSEADIGGGREYRIPVVGRNPVSQASMDAIKNNQVAIVLGGCSSYLDVFGKLHRHTVRSHLEFGPDGFELVASPRHNRGN